MIAIETTPVDLAKVRAQLEADQARERQLLDAFHRFFYTQPTWSMTMWAGVPAMKSPCDLFALQDIIVGLRPALIIETGVAYGGSTLFMAHVCDLIGHGVIIAIDLEPHEQLPQHSRITYRRGSSVDPEIVGYATERASRAGGPVMVILDSDHHAPHVSTELNAYAHLVTPGSFLIVEDTNINGHPVLPEWGPGPAESVAAFLVDHPEFSADILPERYGVTMHPGGWLRRAL